jgi:tetratricopeptide (TPR) repeat protein
MPRTLFLHIGTTKTGSTSIQHILHTRRKTLPAQGVAYPATPGDNRHILLATAYTSYPEMWEERDLPIWEGREPAKRIAAYLGELKAELTALPTHIDRVILSAEHFATHLRAPEDIKRLHDDLQPFFDRMKVIVYLRRQDLHFASMHAQFVRLGNTNPPDMDRLTAFHHEYDYAALIGRWAEAFGEHAMIPRLFEGAKGARFDVVEDFATICGLTLAIAPDDNARARNLSMTLPGQNLLLELGRTLQATDPDATNATAIASRTLWQRLSETVSAAAPGSGWQPTRAEARAFVARFAQSNEAVRQRWFPDRPTLFAEDFDKLPEHAPIADTAAILGVAGAALLHALRTGLQREHKLLMDKAKLAEALGDTKMALASLTHAVRCDAHSRQARLQLARALIKAGDWDAARLHAEAALKLDPDHPGATALMRRVERRLARRPGALPLDPAGA